MDGALEGYGHYTAVVSGSSRSSRANTIASPMNPPATIGYAMTITITSSMTTTATRKTTDTIPMTVAITHAIPITSMGTVAKSGASTSTIDTIIAAPACHTYHW